MVIVTRLVARLSRGAQILLLSTLALPVALMPTARAGSESVADVVAKVSPAVVRVFTVRQVARIPGNPGWKSVAEAADRTSAIGSGFIIDPSGYIATNKHVVDGAISLFVVTADGVRYPVSVIGFPEKADIALLRIDAKVRPLPFVRFGDSDQMRVGDRGRPRGARQESLLDFCVGHGMKCSSTRSNRLVNPRLFGGVPQPPVSADPSAARFKRPSKS